jgi:hypothetical protein
LLVIKTELHDLRALKASSTAELDPAAYDASQLLALKLRALNSNGIIYPSIRHSGGECVGLFFPDCASEPIQGRHLDYHWDGTCVDLVRDVGNGQVFRVVEAT